MNNPARAIPFFEQAKFDFSDIMDKKDVIKINSGLAESYYKNKNLEKALPLFLEIIEIEPANFEARFNYAYLLHITGDNDQAISHLETIIAKAKETSNFYLGAKKLLLEIRGY